jgi:uncharacterized protein YndB with AHSA1/START domain
MSQEPTTRSHETTIEIAAPPETVWKGITEASEIVRWFAPEARVEPGEGGQYFVSWGPGMGGTSRITIWEPERHLQVVEDRKFAGGRKEGCVEPTDAIGAPAQIAVDYYLEAKGGSTVLRLVHSGFGMTADWDNEFESTHYGWMMFLRNLRHALTRHLRTPCRQAMLMVESPLPAPETWAKVMGPEGFLASGTIDGLKEGDRFAWRTATGEEISGQALMPHPPIYIGGSMEQANDSLFGITSMPKMLMLTFMFYGLSEAQAEAIQSRWTELVRSAVSTSAAWAEARA